jgi:hypothetical protein
MRTAKKGKEGTVWVLDANNKPVPHKVKIIMTDGIRTAIETDLPEGTVLVNGVAPANMAAAPAQQGGSPFLPKMGPRKKR